MVDFYGHFDRKLTTNESHKWTVMSEWNEVFILDKKKREKKII